jgi:hypothetical protein
MGYGRVSYDEPGLSLLSNPASFSQNAEYAQANGTTRLLSVGLEDTHRFGPALSLTWGVEVDRLKAIKDQVFVSPSATINYRVTDSTQILVGMTSRRATVGNTIYLPDGQVVSLANPVQITNVGNYLRWGWGQYYFGSITQTLGVGTTVEFAYFDNRYQGSVYPVLALLELEPVAEVLNMPGQDSGSNGYRFSIKKNLIDRISARFSYLRAVAPGLSNSLLEGTSLNSGFFSSLERNHFHALTTQIDAKIPQCKTRIMALFKVVPGPDPLVALDPLTDIYETGNEGISVFIRQVIPIPTKFLGFLGLESFSPDSIEALFDIRNLLDGGVGTIQTPEGTFALLQNPRSFRGGFSLRF